ncbi:long-chain-fatty-acid--CoA ligase [Dactylosporangium sp. NPDC000555]|uniref:long-chain-fatty-acid--CoA ligase n=1 Tax=Dactylosporangium sp. NPDC000555 TaxID=3154260 RepID=UPI00331B619C
MSEPTVGELLLARAGDDRTGLRFEGASWTWDEHVRASAQRAAWLAGSRRPGPFHVGVLLDNVPEFSLMLGAAALGGSTVVGLNRTRRGAELARDIWHTDCQVVLTEERYLPLLDGVPGLPPVVTIDGSAYPKLLAEHEGAPIPDRLPPADALFMLIFTSGTTGAPKAVRCTQGTVGLRAARMAVTTGMTTQDTVYIAMPMFHSNSIVAGWGPALAGGATMVLKRRFSASEFVDDVRAYGVTYTNYVGKPLSYILATPPGPDDADNPLRLAYGNEASEHDIAEFARRFDTEVVDAFGSTEGGARFYRTPETPSGSLGLARGDVRIVDPDTVAERPRAVFDAGGRLRNPLEAVGEIVNFDGPGTFEGYYNNDEATALRLRDGRYHSGDLGYRDEAGFFYFAGRSQEWLRVDGENLAVAPIERVLARHPDVVLAAVYAVPDPVAGDQVMTALVLHEGRPFDPEGFAAWFAVQPDTGTKWAPAFVRVAERLPQTATNKVVKATLAMQRWNCADPVWWCPPRSAGYRRLEAADVEAIRARFAAHGRERLLT